MNYSIKPEDLLHGLEEQKEANRFCDIVLEVEGKLFQAHKAVLAAVSPYVASYLEKNAPRREIKLSPKKNANKLGWHGKIETIALPELHADGVEAVINCIYTTELKVTDATLEHTLAAAHHLQISSITELCGTYISNNMTNDQCLNYLKLVEKYDLSQSKHAIDSIIMQKFSSLMQDESFLMLPAETLIRFLSSSRLHCPSEIELFEAVNRWLSHDKSRLQHAQAVMEKIRFTNISAEQLTSKVATSSFMVENAACREYLLDALAYHADIYSQPIHSGTSYQPRGEVGLVLLDHGDRAENSWATTGEGSDMYICSWNRPDHRMRKFRFAMPFVSHSICTVRINNFIFVLGADNRSFSATTWRYSGTTGDWVQLASVPQAATIGSCASVVPRGQETFILLCGGMTVTPATRLLLNMKKVINNCFKYTVRTNYWDKLPDVPERLVFASSVSYQGVTYLAGGCMFSKDKPIASRAVYSYEISSNKWSSKANMNHGRVEFTLVTTSGALYAVGGRNVPTGSVQDKVDHPIPPEVYSFSSNQWTTLSTDGYPRLVQAVSFSYDNNIFLVGGEDLNAGASDEAGEIKVFNTQTKVWSTSKKRLHPDIKHFVSANLLMVPYVQNY